MVNIENMNIQLPDKFDWVDTSDYFFSNVLDKCLNSRKNLFIDGRAGSGKSLCIKILSSMKKNTIILSTTGLTALNLTTNDIIAYTPHSFLMISPMEIIPSSDLTKSSRNLSFSLRKCSLLVIDEVSMMSNQLFDFIIEKIKYLRNGSIPRIILFGDPNQLAPVVDRNNAIVNDYYNREYSGNTMFFNSNSFNNLNFEILNLQKSYRQKDPIFEKALIDIGINEFDDSTLEYFNQRVMTQKDFINTHKSFIQICSTNSMVNKINNDYINNFSGKEMTYNAVITGKFQLSKDLNDKIKIKEGSQVICLVNNYKKEDGSDYRNGTIGIVLEVRPDSLIIEKSDGNITKVVRTTINNYEIFVNDMGLIDYRIIGSYNQIDAKVCRALTIHKIQGKTLDDVYISLGNWTAPGMTYVALSRVKTLQGLGLSRPLRRSDIMINQESFDFFQSSVNI